MNARRIGASARGARRLLLGVAVGGAVLAATAVPANAAVTATFTPASGVLTVFGDSLDNQITVGRNAAGAILINNGATIVVGGTPTVANTTTIQVFGQAGNDTVTLNESLGALPAAQVFGGAGNDTLTGGSGADLLFGQAGDDTLLGKGGKDQLFGGDGNDSLTGGDDDDQAFGQAGNDRLVWNPGDDTDLDEGGDGSDTVEVNGGAGAEQFTATANGSRVRFDRLNPAPFTLDIGTAEDLVVHGNGGNDQFTGSNGLAPLIKLTVDGGTGNDTLTGGDGNDTLLGGDGNDAVAGGRGDDTALLGAGDDSFVWNPGDNNDTIEGQAGNDTLRFNGANVSEKFALSANGSRLRFTRDVANITMDTGTLENVDLHALGGADTLTVDSLAGTGVTRVATDLAAGNLLPDNTADSVIVNGTSGSDVVVATGDQSGVAVLGLAAEIDLTGADAAIDHLALNGLAGDDVLDASSLTAGAPLLTLDGGDGDDVLIGGAGADSLLGGNGDDILIGGPGDDVIDGGAGSNIVIDDGVGNSLISARAASDSWLAAHIVDSRTVLDAKGTRRALPRADLSGFMRTVSRGQVKAALARALSAARIGRGHRVAFVAPGPGRVELAWYLGWKHRVVVARAHGRLAKTGAARLELELTHRGRRALAGAKRLKLVAQGRFTPAGGTVITVSKRITAWR